MSQEELLAAWLPHQRWFAGKGRPITGIEVATEVVLVEKPDVRLLVLDVSSDDGGRDYYQLLLGRQPGELPERLAHAALGNEDGQVVYDALHDVEATGALLGRLSDNDGDTALDFHSVVDLDRSLTSRVMGAEQSNTSVVYGEDYILKVFRRLEPGLNPDLEVTGALARAGSLYVPPPLAWYEGPVGGELTTLAMMAPFLRNASEGWAMATASVRDLFAEGDLHADEVGGDFAGEAERLGAATADVHAMMREELPTAQAGPAESVRTATQLHERLDAAVAVVSELAPLAGAVHRAYELVERRQEPVVVQRIHGDLHLGQVLRTQDRWTLLDFEGEPARPLAERTALMSPLRDVAGMLRSFDYAARHLLAERGETPGDGLQLAYRAAEWAERNREAFCDGYARTAGADPRDEPDLLRAFELDKAVYEVVYEARHRPTWIGIPLDSIRRIVGGAP